MKTTPLLRFGAVLVVVLAAGSIGYILRGDTSAVRVDGVPNIPAQTICAPTEGSSRIIYSLDKKQNDQEIITIIENAKEYIYFAIYTFTLQNIADALVEAKKRGVAVYGIVDSGQATLSSSAPIIKQLVDAGIPIRTERRSDARGIMHLKTIVTESAYATGSYNWTRAGTTINDEILEIGTDPALRQAYENILKRLFEAYKGTNAATSVAVPVLSGTYDYTEANNHIGEYAAVRGRLINAHTSSRGTVFLNFCTNYRTCPFYGVIFADDSKRFGDLSSYEGSVVTLTGKISSYEGRAQIILSSPHQLRN